jgi:hypothetical protein
MGSAGFVGEVLAGFADALQPLEVAVSGPAQFAAFIAELGWPADPGPSAAQLQAAFGTIGQDLAALAQAAQAFRALPAQADPSAIAGAVASLGAAIGSVASDAASLAGTATAGLPAPLNDSGFWESLTAELLDKLLYDYLQKHLPALFGVLRFLGIAAADPIPAAGQRSDYTQCSIDWTRLGSAASNPGQVFADVYGWASAFDHLQFIDNALTLLGGFGAPAYPDLPESALLGLYYNPAAPVSTSVVELHAPLYWGIIGVGGATTTVEFSLVILPIPDSGDTTGEPVGFVLAPELTAQAAEATTLAPGVVLNLGGSFGSVGALRLEIRPAGATVAASGLGSTTTFSASAKLTASPTPPWTLLGSPGSTSLQIERAHAALGLAGSITEPEVTVQVAIDAGQLVLDFGEGDGFLQDIFGGQPQTFAFAVGGQWSSRTGFTFNGQGQIQATIPAQVSVLGVVDIDSVFLSLGAQAGPAPGTQLVVAITGAVQLGPVSATISHVGLQASASPLPAGTHGNLGDLAIAFGFRPPDGLGLSLDAAPVSGAGFVAYDAANARYLGALALAIGDLSVSAVGVLDTAAPGGGPGYSLVIVASADFPPVELGFGFSLVGIGGLVGVNRTTNVPVLQALARAGQLDSLMFPADLAHRAPQVAASLEQVFPAAQGHFIVGPAVRIEWGTGGMVDAEVGVFIELSDSGGGISLLRVALLGWVHLTLPDVLTPVADLTLDVLGVADLTAKTLSLDAGLRNSTIASFPLTGQAALRASWGASPSFVFAIGGFNPHFAVPAGFPALQRIALSIGGSDPRLRFSAYLALTSNTVQFGCAADLYASAGPAAVAASLSFDALLQFQPFGLIVDLTINATVLLGGSPVLSLSLDLHVTGPTPWAVTGSASFQVLCCSFTVPISITAGPQPPPQPPQTVDLDDNLTTALADSRSWQTGPPAGHGVVTVRGQNAASSAVHPLGTLTVRQHAVPLELHIERYGPDLLDAACSYQITAATIGGLAAQAADVTDFFAPAQFQTMTDAQKLSAPSFEPMTAGTTLGSAGLSLPQTAGAAGSPATVVDTASTRQFDVLMLDSPDPGTVTGSTAGPVTASSSTATLPSTVLAAQLPAAAAAVNGAAGRGPELYAAPGCGIAVEQPTYAIVGMNLAALGSGRPISMGLPSVVAAVGAQAGQPGQAGQAGQPGPTGQDWQVVYTSEVPG